MKPDPFTFWLGFLMGGAVMAACFYYGANA